MDILQIKNYENGLFGSDMKVKRSNRTTFVIYGTFNITDDLSNYEVWHEEMKQKKDKRKHFHILDGYQILLQCTGK